MFKNIISTVNKVGDVLTGAQKKSIAGLFVLMLFSALTEAFGISLIIPYFSVLTEPQGFITGRAGTVINGLFGVSEQNEVLILLTVILIIAFGVKYSLSYVIRLKQTNFVNKNRFLMAQRMMRYLIREEYERYLYRNMTEEINLVTTHVTWTFELIGALLSAMVQVLNVLFLTVFMFVADIRITLLFGIGIVLLYVLFHRIFSNKVKLAGNEANKTWEEYDKTISESFLLKKENDVFRRNDEVFDTFCFWGKRNVAADERKIKYGMLPGLATNLISVWTILFLVLFLLSSGNSIIAGLGKLSAFYFAVTRIIPGVNSIYACLQQMAFYSPSLDKVNEVLKTFNGIDSVKTLDYESYPMRKSIRLDDVSFKYRNSDGNVLEHISFEIRCGERIGIIGKTGSGKTTLINLIIGLLKPTAGEISIDGKKQNESLLYVGYVPQDTNLLDSTIRENIAFGRNADDSEIKCAVRAAGLDDFIRQLPRGLDTEIGSQGVRLSGGQRQRIGIARALIGSPSVLIFDEATSSLDLKTEQEIIETIKSLGCEKTVIMVSHRPNTLQFCERWACVEEHRLKEVCVCP